MADTSPSPRAIFDKMMEQDLCSQWMGIELVEISKGHCKICMQVKRDMLNGFGVLQGGIAFTFADAAFAFASNTLGRKAVSINGSMQYARSAQEGDRLIAEATPLHIGYKTADFDVNVYLETSGEIYYRFRGTVYRSSTPVLEI